MQKCYTIFFISNDLSKTWNTINETINRNKKRKRPSDEFDLANGSIITDHKITANEFNKYFVSIGGSVGNNQSNTTNDVFHTYLTDKPNCTLKFKLANVTEIIDIINKLKPKSSSGVDDLYNKVIKHIQEIIAEPLTIIINQMLNTGIFPDSPKISISKIIEKGIFKQMSEYFENNDLIFQNQYGLGKIIQPNSHRST